jgi:chloramphenicol-sensitive protein RarD
VLYALGAYGAWGFAPLYWRALDAVPASEILAHRVVWSFVTGLLLIVVLRRRDDFRAALKSRRQLWPLVASAFLIGTNWLVFIWAVETDRVLATSLGYYINPLISVSFGTLILGERLRPAQRLAVALATIGVIQLGWSVGRLPWISLVLAISFALYGLVRKLAPVMPVVGFALETAILAPLGAMYLAIAHANGDGTGFGGSTATSLLLVGSGGFTAIPLLCFNSAAKRLNLSTIGLFQYLAPSIAFVLAVALWDEPFTRAHAITFGCVWTALAIYSLDAVRVARGSGIRAPG